MSQTSPTAALGRRTVGGGHASYVVAEAGSNHDGDREVAHRLIDAAADAGADAVKFQVFKASRLYAGTTEVAEYLVRAGSAPAGARVVDLLRPYELPYEWLAELATHARERGVDFVATPFDVSAVDALARLTPPFLKIASSELLHVPLLRHAASTGLPLVLSTGLATLEEVAFAVECARAAGAVALVLLQCVVAYPALAAATNLRVMRTYERAFGLPAGLSDHTLGTTVPIAAAAVGAAMIEKHFTLDRSRTGPDHRYALEPGELAAMIRAVREAESALGDGIKRVDATEAPLLPFRAGIVSTRRIPRDTPLSRDDVTVKRPGHGISPRFYDQILGRRARMDIPPETVLTWDML